eukprot:359159-Chlamydomonas_euryale.AAC.1
MHAHRHSHFIIDSHPPPHSNNPVPWHAFAVPTRPPARCPHADPRPALRHWTAAGPRTAAAAARTAAGSCAAWTHTPRPGAGGREGRQSGAEGVESGAEGVESGAEGVEETGLREAAKVCPVLVGHEVRKGRMQLRQRNHQPVPKNQANQRPSCSLWLYANQLISV